MLDKFQSLLETRFAALAQERASVGYPVYAFEHGFDTDTVAEIRSELQRTTTLLARHWLVWLAISAEIGYTYDGDEYWASYVSQLPRWPEFGRRETIRDWFRQFAARYSGFVPGGRWAEHFSIIAWPISHSILPRYLQSRFAKHLHDVRYDLSRSSALSTDELGAVARDTYQGGSSRFEDFLQQTGLTGRLILALRDEDVQDRVPPITRDTLARIIRDLSERRAARDYLEQARSVLRDARLRGPATLSGPPGTGRTPSDAQRLPSPEEGRAKLVARRGADGRWSIGITLPDFGKMLRSARVPLTRLDQTRIRFHDQPERWWPARALLGFSGQDKRVTSLPWVPTEPIISFERNVAGLSDLLGPSLLLGGGPTKLLRLHGDGAARQVIGGHVRSGQSYLIVTSTPVLPQSIQSLSMNSAECQMDGAFLYALNVPNFIDDTYLRALETLGCGYSLRANVKPLGLSPRWDNNSGTSVWLPTEEVLFAVSADFEIGEYIISLNGADGTRIAARHGETYMVSLGRLPLGRHLVVVAAASTGRALAGGRKRTVEPEHLTLDVRSPVPWQEGVRKQSGFRLLLDPASASLATVLRDQATITIHGPTGRKALVTARTFDARGELTGTHLLGSIVLPCSWHTMHRLVSKLETGPLAEAIQSSPQIDIVVSVDELGADWLTFPKKIAPLRWKLEGGLGGSTARLVDETGIADSLTITQFEMTRPDHRINIEAVAAFAGVPVGPPGSLLIARYRERSYGAVIGIADRNRLASFADLGFDIHLAEPGSSPLAIPRLLLQARRWEQATPLGSLATLRKAKIVAEITHHITRIACGTEWADLLRACREGNAPWLDRLQRELGGSPGFASRMRSTSWNSLGLVDGRTEFTRLSQLYTISDNHDVSEVAWRLAFEPGEFLRLTVDQLRPLFQRFQNARVLARGAFFAALVAQKATAPGFAAVTAEVS